MIDSIQKLLFSSMFKNPFITLKDEMNIICLDNKQPISLQISSGDFLKILIKGNTTKVRSPSNSFLVF